MKRLILFLLLGVSVHAQTITGAAVQAGGWDIWLYVTGLNTNGAHDLGWFGNNYIGSNKLTLTLTSKAYNDAGEETTEGRVLYGTKQLRIPATTNNQETVTASGLILKYGLTEYVAAGCTNLSLNTLTGLYSQGGSNLAAVTSMAVTNLSTQNYPQVIANWSWPGFTYVDSTTVTQYVFGAEASARNGRPLRLVRGTATDGTNTATVTALRMAKSSFGGAIESPDYQLVFDLSSFPRPNYIRFDFAAFPWIGDTNSVLDTAKVSDIHPTPKPAGITNLVDGSSAFPIVRAIVATNGNNTTGVAATRTYWATNTSPPAFATVGGALVAIAATNNALHGFNHTSGGIIKMRAGRHGYLGSTCTLANGPRIFVELEPEDGVSRDDVVFHAAVTDARCTDDKDMLLMRNVTMSVTNATMFLRHAHLWHDQCQFLDSTASALFQASGGVQNNWYITRCVISNLTQGIRPFTTQPMSPAIVRGNRIVGNTTSLQIFTTIGNVKEVGGSTQFSMFTDVGGGSTPVGWGQIAAYNAVFNARLLGNILSVGTVSNINKGFIFANNLFEQCTNNTASTAYFLAVQEGLNYTNVMTWHNTMVGTKNFFGYNDNGTNVWYRWLWSHYNNIWEDDNEKSDEFGTPDPNRVGNWPMRFGAYSAGNVLLETLDVGATLSFTPDFVGTFAWMPTTDPSTTNFPAFRNRLAFDGTNVMSGGGDYRLHTRSPIWNLTYDYRNRVRKWVLPFDLRGNYRGESDPPGAFNEGNARTSAK